MCVCALWLSGPLGGNAGLAKIKNIILERKGFTPIHSRCLAKMGHVFQNGHKFFLFFFFNLSAQGPGLPKGSQVLPFVLQLVHDSSASPCSSYLFFIFWGLERDPFFLVRRGLRRSAARPAPSPASVASGQRARSQRSREASAPRSEPGAWGGGGGAHRNQKPGIKQPPWFSGFGLVVVGGPFLAGCLLAARRNGQPEPHLR